MFGSSVFWFLNCFLFFLELLVLVCVFLMGFPRLWVRPFGDKQTTLLQTNLNERFSVHQEQDESRERLPH